MEAWSRCSPAEQVTTDSCGISSQRVDKILFYSILNLFKLNNFSVGLKLYHGFIGIHPGIHGKTPNYRRKRKKKNARLKCLTIMNTKITNNHLLSLIFILSRELASADQMINQQQSCQLTLLVSLAMMTRVLFSRFYRPHCD